MLPPHLIDALYTAHQADARSRELELERARRTAPHPRVPRQSRAETHWSRQPRLRSLISRLRTARSAADDA